MDALGIEKAKRNIGRMIDQGAPESDIDAYLKTEGLSAMDVRHGGPVDTDSGAPWKTRALVGLYDDPARRLEVLRGFAPDAKPEGDDNFVFTDPSTGRKTLYNPKGLDVGDVLSLGRDAATLTGSTLGAAAGTVGATPGLGTVVGAGAGGMVGGMAADKLADMFSGVQRSPGEQAKSMLWDAGTNAAGEGVGGAVARSLGPSVSRLTGMTGDKLSELAAKYGVPLPTRGTAWQNRGIQTLEQGVANTIGGANIMEQASQKSLAALRSAVDQSAGGLGTIYPNAEALGARALDAAGVSLDNLRQAAAQRYGAVYGGIEKEPVQGLASTQKYIQDTFDAISDPAERELFLKDPLVQRALNLSTSPAVDVLTLKNALTDMRTKWRPGSAIDTSTASDAQVNGLLSSLAADRDAAVAGLGRGQALNDANQWYAAEKGLRSQLESIFGKEHSPVDLDLLLGRAGGGGKVPLNAAEVGKKLLDPNLPRNQQEALSAVLGQDYGDIAATRLARMADATPGAQGATGDTLFSPSTFLTNWNRSAKTGGEALTPADFDELLKISAALKDAEKMANTSGTARALAGSSMLTGLGYGASDMMGGDQGRNLKGAALGALAPVAAAALLANPRLVTSPGAMRAYSLTPGLLSRAALSQANP